MLPDDLVGSVPLEPLRTRVPAQDKTLRVEREDGIVLHAFDKKPVQLARLVRDPTGGRAATQDLEATGEDPFPEAAVDAARGLEPSVMPEELLGDGSGADVLGWAVQQA